jgi:uncharacterized membrane protein YhiD involved in acid resistance
MSQQVPSRWTELQDAFTLPEESSLVVVGATLLLGGVLGIFVRLLYRFGSPQASSNSISRIFPLLTMVTIAVIAVVKSSLALSLGLVGALSIVRFRAAIKDPEELVYLFLCIGIGLALGAQQVWLALSLVAVTTVFVLVFDRIARPGQRGQAFLTISGDADRHFRGDDGDALSLVRKKFPKLRVERCEVDGDEGELRVQLFRIKTEEAATTIASLREQLPGCRISFVNAEVLG